jgi:hypothetical protein
MERTDYIFRGLPNNSDDIDEAIAAISGVPLAMLPAGVGGTVGPAHQRCTRMKVQVVMEGMTVAQNFEARWRVTVVGQIASGKIASLAGVGQRALIGENLGARAIGMRNLCVLLCTARPPGERRRNGKGQ